MCYRQTDTSVASNSAESDLKSSTPRWVSPHSKMRHCSLPSVRRWGSRALWKQRTVGRRKSQTDGVVDVKHRNEGCRGERTHRLTLYFLGLNHFFCADRQRDEHICEPWSEVSVHLKGWVQRKQKMFFKPQRDTLLMPRDILGYLHLMVQGYFWLFHVALHTKFGPQDQQH